MDRWKSYKKKNRKNKLKQEAIVMVRARLKRTRRKQKPFSQVSVKGVSAVQGVAQSKPTFTRLGVSSQTIKPVIGGDAVPVNASDRVKAARIVGETSYRVHGAGNYVMITEEGMGSAVSKRYPATETKLQEILKSGEAVLVDAGHLSKVQLGGVLGTIRAADQNVKFETVVRSGRTMITAKKKESLR